jgi:hypothetical protein
MFCYEHAATIKSPVLAKADRCPGAFLTAAREDQGRWLRAGLLNQTKKDWNGIGMTFHAEVT